MGSSGINGKYMGCGDRQDQHLPHHSTGGDRANTWWMGATDMHHEGGWVWMSGNPWSYVNWNEGEPNQNGNEDCGAFDSQADGFKWMDLECNSANHGVPHYAVCEKMIEA